jgi:hypothetical protein
MLLRGIMLGMAAADNFGLVEALAMFLYLPLRKKREGEGNSEMWGFVYQKRDMWVDAHCTNQTV